MRRVREVLRLRTAVVGLNEIARRLGVAPSTVRLTLKRLASATLDIASEGGPQSFELRAGMVAVIPQGVWHRFRSSEGATVMTATPFDYDGADAAGGFRSGAPPDRRADCIPSSAAWS
jgi:hypothetical protein